VRKHQAVNFANADELIDDIRKAAKIRNALCHGSWRAPNAAGQSAIYYFDKKDGKFEALVDLAWLRQVQAHVKGVALTVIDSVTVLGVT
jgi:hypothetical protein